MIIPQSAFRFVCSNFFRSLKFHSNTVRDFPMYMYKKGGRTSGKCHDECTLPLQFPPRINLNINSQTVSGPIVFIIIKETHIIHKS